MLKIFIVEKTYPFFNSMFINAESNQLKILQSCVSILIRKLYCNVIQFKNKCFSITL